MTPSTHTASDVISSDKVEGTSVYNDAGDKLGSIDDLMIDKRSGQVRYAVMKFGGFLGIDTEHDWGMAPVGPALASTPIVIRSRGTC